VTKGGNNETHLIFKYFDILAYYLVLLGSGTAANAQQFNSIFSIPREPETALKTLCARGPPPTGETPGAGGTHCRDGKTFTPTFSETLCARGPPPTGGVGRVAKPLKPATARDPGRHRQPCQIANKSKATPMSPFATEPAPSADPNNTDNPAKPGNQRGFRICAERCELAHQRSRQVIYSTTLRPKYWGHPYVRYC
jgi:hypothetical protein